MHPTLRRKLGRPSPATLLALVALVVASSGVAMGAIPGASDGTITTCADSKGALRVIDAEAGETCNATRAETTLAWKDGSTLLGKTEKAADADKLDGLDSGRYARFGGRVTSDGTAVQGEGFTVTRLSAGRYRVAFPDGTFAGCHFPIATFTPASFSVQATPIVIGASCNQSGGASVQVRFRDPLGVDTDTPFAFIAM